MAQTLPTAKEVEERLRNLPQVKRWRQGNYEPSEWLTSAPSPEGGSWGRKHKLK